MLVYFDNQYITSFFNNSSFFPHLYLTTLTYINITDPHPTFTSFWLTPLIVTFCTPFSLSPFSHLPTFFSHS